MPPGRDKARLNLGLSLSLSLGLGLGLSLGLSLCVRDWVSVACVRVRLRVWGLFSERVCLCLRANASLSRQLDGMRRLMPSNCRSVLASLSLASCRL